MEKVKDRAEESYYSVDGCVKQSKTEEKAKLIVWIEVPM